MNESEQAERPETCLFCEISAREAEYFIVSGYSGLCDRCVGYVMSVTAVDDRALFERLVDRARMYGNNAEAARVDEAAVPTLSGGVGKKD